MKKSTSINQEELSVVLWMAGKGKTTAEIHRETGIKGAIIRRVCRASRVDITRVIKAKVRDAPIPKPPGIAAEKARVAAREAAIHPLVAMGKGEPPIVHARLILKSKGLLWTRRGIPWLNDKYATPRLILQEANRILKAEGQSQLGSPDHWV